MNTVLTSRRYNQQRHVTKGRIDAAGNPIEFRLSFDEWFQIWSDSGFASQMGVGRGKYCMSRLNDIGHYEVGNVFIQDHFKNLEQAWLVGYSPSNPKSPEHRRKISIGVRKTLFRKSTERLAAFVNTLSKGD